MKVGDTLVVSMGGFSVAQAVIEEIDGDRATIYIPATRVVMGVATSLTDLDPEVDRVFAGETDKLEPEAPVQEEKPAAQPADTTAHPDDIGEGLGSVKLDSSALD